MVRGDLPGWRQDFCQIVFCIRCPFYPAVSSHRALPKRPSVFFYALLNTLYRSRPSRHANISRDSNILYVIFDVTEELAY